MNETTTLYYREGSSDKVYQAHLCPSNGGFVVNFAFGRRGSTLQTGTKTQTPISYEAAKFVFDRLVLAKIAKGYMPGENGTSYQHSTLCQGYGWQADSEQKASGVLPQLLNPIEESQVERYIYDPCQWMQEKHDGRRLLVRKDGNTVEGINRKGWIVGLPETIQKSAQAMTGDFILDGEAVGETLHVFDLLMFRGRNLRKKSYAERFLALKELRLNGSIKIVATAITPQEKRLIFGGLKARDREGVVFKDYRAPYTSGRPSSGGDQLKHKFTATASFVVSRVNAQRSVGLSLHSYSSHQYSITLKTELPDINQVQAESNRLHRLLQDAVDKEIREVGYLPVRNEPPIPRDVMPPAFPPQNGNNGNGGNGNGHLNDTWNCSDKQKSLILKIVEEHRLDKNQVESLAKERFNAPVKALNKMQASGLIDELLDQVGAKRENNGNRNNRYRRTPERQGAR